MNEPISDIFPPRGTHGNWGWFGYEGSMCDRAIRADNPKMIAECVRLGWINPASEMMSGCPRGSRRRRSAIDHRSRKAGA